MNRGYLKWMLVILTGWSTFLPGIALVQEDLTKDFLKDCPFYWLIKFQPINWEQIKEERKQVTEQYIKDNWIRLIVEATAYNEQEKSCEKLPSHPEFGITASGTRVGRYRTIAASHQMALGSIVYIPDFKSYPNRGIRRVEDRGGAIKGNRIDIYMPSSRSCRVWGRRRIIIYLAPTKEEGNKIWMELISENNLCR